MDLLRALADDDGHLSPEQLDELVERAERQQARLQRRHLAAAHRVYPVEGQPQSLLATVGATD